MAYEAVVYDLDGTLARLAVDWEAVEAELADLLRAADGEPGDASTWEYLAAAEVAGVGEEAHERIAVHERAGARESTRLPTADELPTGVPTGVCSLNEERAVRIALDRHDLSRHVSAVVGRGTIPQRKPDPAPLLHAVDQLDADPEATLFVGDSDSDEVCASRAGTAFRYVE